MDHAIAMCRQGYNKGNSDKEYFNDGAIACALCQHAQANCE